MPDAKSYTGKEKRRFPRIPLVSEVEFKVHVDKKQYKGVISNISAGGVAIITDSKIDPLSMLRMSFGLPNGSEFKELKGLVVRHEPWDHSLLLGIRFVDLPDKLRAEIAKWVIATHGP